MSCAMQESQQAPVIVGPPLHTDPSGPSDPSAIEPMTDSANNAARTISICSSRLNPVTESRFCFSVTGISSGSDLDPFTHRSASAQSKLPILRHG